MYGIYANIGGILMVNGTPYMAYMDPMGYDRVKRVFFFLHVEARCCGPSPDWGCSARHVGRELKVWLVVFRHPSEKYERQVGMISNPIFMGKFKIHGNQSPPTSCWCDQNDDDDCNLAKTSTSGHLHQQTCTISGTPSGRQNVECRVRWMGHTLAIYALVNPLYSTVHGVFNLFLFMGISSKCEDTGEYISCSFIFIIKPSLSHDYPSI